MANEQHPGPWVWDSNCGEWGLWDAAGEPLIMEYTFSDPSESVRLDPYVEAVTAAAPEMLALLRIAAYETQPNGVCGDIHTTGTFRADMLALIARIDAAAVR